MEVCAKVEEPEQVLQASRTSQSSKGYSRRRKNEKMFEGQVGKNRTNKLAGRDEDTKSEVFPLHVNKEVETEITVRLAIRTRTVP